MPLFSYLRFAGLVGMFVLGFQFSPALLAQTPAPAGTFTIQNGQAPWSDRVGQWALAGVPAELAGTTPLPQQNCGSRSLVVPAGANSVTVGVSVKDLPAFTAAYPIAVVLPETFAIQNQKGQSIPYGLAYVASPPTTLKGSFGAGLILFAVNAAAPAAAPAAGGVPDSSSISASLVKTPVPAGTFVVQNGSFPWSDRVGQWALAEVPAKFAGTTPLPQQNCGSRSVVVPAGTTSVVVGISGKDVPAFMTAFPTALLLPEIFSVQNPGGQTIAYSLVYVPSPPALLKGTFQSGLVLFALNTAAPAAGSALIVPKLAPAYAPVPLAVPSDKSKFEVYLLIGQSNMLGRDTSKLDSQVDNPRIGSMDARGNWFVGHEPLWGGSGTGPGLSFAADILAARPADVKIGLISCAVGGTPLSRWGKGGDLYERALSRAKLAMKAGTLKGAIWHQGESDSKTGLAETYQARLTKMLADLRADLGNPSFPVVVGQLGMFFDPKPTSEASVVRGAIKKIGSTVPHTGFADSASLDHKGDHLHFTADAQTEFGHRYAKAMLELQAQK